jgi:UrcA family protein
MTRTQITASALAFAVALAAAAPALAAPLAVSGDDEKVAVTVRYDDAELRSTDGAAKLAFRIRMAARQVCSGGSPLVAIGAHFQSCQHKAIDRAVATLGAPLVADALGRAPQSVATR